MKHAMKNFSLGNENFLVINLGRPIFENMEVYPGDPKPKKDKLFDISKDGCFYNTWIVGEHNFCPHGDAPNHQNPDLMEFGFDTFGMEFFFNRACMLDLTNSPDVITHNNVTYLLKIRADHLENFHTVISDKGATVIRTGYDKYIEQNFRHDKILIPYLTQDAVEFINGFKTLKVIAVDSLSVDPPGCKYAHQSFKDKLIVEGLVNSYLIPENNRDFFDLQTSTISFVGGSGGPVSAFAFIKIS